MKILGERGRRIAAYVLSLLLLANLMPPGNVKANPHENEAYEAVKREVLDSGTLQRSGLEGRDVFAGESGAAPPDAEAALTQEQGQMSGTGGVWEMNADDGGQTPDVSSGEGEGKPDVSSGEGEGKPDVSSGEGEKKPLPDFRFPEEKQEITYQEGITHCQTAVGADGDQYVIAYAISAGEGGQTVAKIDRSTGVVTPERAGTVVVVAVCHDESDTYLDTTASYELTIHKGTRKFVFAQVTEDGSPIEIKYGQSFSNPVLDSPGDGEVTYAVEPAGDGVFVESGGAVIYQTVTAEPVTVRAVKKEDDCYLESVAEYRLRIVYQELPKEAYTIEGEEGENGWFLSDVTVRPNYGYQIGLSGALGDDNSWYDSLTFRDEGTKDRFFYLISPEGYITDRVTLPALKIDKTAPDGLKITYSDLPVNSRKEYEDDKSAVIDYYNKDKIEVTLTVGRESADGSGIASLTYFTNEKGEGAGAVIPVSQCSSNADGTISYTFSCAAIFRGKIAFEAKDVAGWTSRLADGKVIIVDNRQSKIAVEYDDSTLVRAVDRMTLEDIESFHHVSDKNVNLYYAPDVLGSGADSGRVKVLTYTITEDFFYPEDVRFTLYVNGVEAADYRSYAFLGDAAGDNGEGVWRKTGSNQWQADLILKAGTDYVAKLSYEDRSLNGEAVAFNQTEHIYVDDARPSVEVSYSEHSAVMDGITYYQGHPTATILIRETNFRASDVDVRVTAKDANGSEVDVTADGQSFTDYVKDAVHWQAADGDGHRLTLTFDEDAAYAFELAYTDLAGHAAVYGADKKEVYPQDHFIVDNAAMKKALQPVSDMYAQNFTRVVDDKNEQIITPQEAQGSRRWVYGGAAEMHFLFEEANFYGSDVRANLDGLDTVGDKFLEVWRDNVKCASVGDGYQFVDWSEQEDGDANLHMLSLVIGTDNADGSKDGDYYIKVRYTDRSGNSMQEYCSDVITIDTTAPVIAVSYDNHTARGGSYYKKQRVATLQVTDRNIRPQEMTVVVNAYDIMGNELAVEGKLSAWRQGAVKKESWTCTYTYDVDANYRFTLACVDMAEHRAAAADAFTVDLTKPSAGDITIDYSTSLLQKVLSGITFGYYQPTVTVSVTAEDTTSGIEYLEWEYLREEDSSDSNVAEESGRIEGGAITYTEDKKTASAKFKIKATKAKQYAGYVRVRATDRAGNTGNYRTDAGTQIVVDTISPSRTVTYSPAKQVVNKKTGATIAGFNPVSENRNAQLYYDDGMTVTFTVKEANFYAEDVSVKVNDKKRKVTWKKSQEADTWQGTLKIKKEGDYVVTMEYTDRSGNQTVSKLTGKTNSYRSGVITIDKDVPTIDVDYKPSMPVGIVEGTTYYNRGASSVITIREHNFRASDVNAVVTAVNVGGESVAVQDYQQYLKEEDSWISDGDIHRAAISFPADAAYTLHVDYTDLAGRTASYGTDKFTVDTGKPENLNVAYSANIFESILETVTFGFYQSQMTVTLTAEDATAGVHQFTYSYLKSEGVSDVNAELVNGVIPEEEIEFSNGGRTATARFSIPSEALRGDNQFNGTVEFTAADRCGWKTELEDKTRIIVDNISPTADIGYNEPVRKTDGVSYYSGPIEANIEITEANFYPEDVRVEAAKDGGAPQQVDVTWADASVDLHVGTFTLSEDGDYLVTVNYEDRSSNVMEEYQSEQLTIDTEPPVITVEGVKNHSANNGESIGFVLTVDDVNMDASVFEPVLIAQLRDEEGKIYQKDVSGAGTLATVTSGSRYAYTVTNLEQDGVYTLSCPVVDLADNRMDLMRAETGSEIEELVFSVNRNGSTYHLDHATGDINGTFAKDGVDAVITEINVDEVTDNKVTLYKNEETRTLAAGSDYTMKKEGGEGTWHSCTYTVLKDNFAGDGIYRLALYSKDAAGNVAENTLDTKNVEISFVIDTTPPNLIVANLESGRTYPVPEHTVIMQAADNMGLKEINARLDEKDVDLQKRADAADGAQTDESGGDYEFTVAGTDTDPHKVEIVLTDLAGNETVEIIEDFYVTTNKWVRFRRNRPLFFGSIAGLCALAVLPAAAVAVRRRKKGRKL